MFCTSQALENEDAALSSESEALTESECDVSDSTSSKDSSVHPEGRKKKDGPSGK